MGNVLQYVEKTLVQHPPNIFSEKFGQLGGSQIINYYQKWVKLSILTDPEKKIGSNFFAHFNFFRTLKGLN